MEVSKVTKEDGAACISLIKALRVARFDGLNGKDIEALSTATKWLAALGVSMGKQMQAAESPAPTEGFRIKAMGPLPTAPKSRVKSKKK